MLTKSEEQIMNLLWEQNKPLTATEIINLSENKTWKDSYVHLLINSLMKKELITVSGFVKTTKNYARTFSPVVTLEEYGINTIKASGNFESEKIPAMIKVLIEDADESVLNDIQTVINEKKEQLK